MGTGANWGGDREMSAWEGLMWRAESDPRTRSTGILLELLDSEPDPDRFRDAMERCVARFPRLRDLVAEPLLPVGQPVWIEDTCFDLADHVRIVHQEPATGMSGLLAHCEQLMAMPFDQSRPPWEAVLITGLEGGQAALAFKFHHSLTDGLGLVQLLAMAHGAPEDDADPKSGSESPRSASPTGLLANRVYDLARDAPRRSLQGAADAIRLFRRTVARPVETASAGLTFGRSLGRMLASPSAGRSPLMSTGGIGSRLLVLDVPLDDLRAGGKAAGGSVNDAFVAAVLGGLRRYHEAFGVEVATVPLSMPISLRAADDPMGGNRFAGVRIAAPLFEPDVEQRIEVIRNLVLQARAEPAIGFLDYLSPVLTKLPAAAIIELSANLTSSSDLQLSNIRGLDDAVRLAGANVVGTYPLGPRPGVGLMGVLMTYNGTCCLGFNVNPDAFTDLDLLEKCLREGFLDVTALAPESGPAS